MAIRHNPSSMRIQGRTPIELKAPASSIKLNFHKINNIDDPEILLASLQKLLQESTLPSLVEIGLANCPACQEAQESLEEIVTKNQGLNIITVNLDALSEEDRVIFMEKFKAENRKPGLPTIRFFHAGTTTALTEKHLVSNTWLGREHLEKAIKNYLPGALRTAQGAIHAT